MKNTAHQVTVNVRPIDVEVGDTLINDIGGNFRPPQRQIGKVVDIVQNGDNYQFTTDGVVRHGFLGLREAPLIIHAHKDDLLTARLTRIRPVQDAR